MTTFALTRRGLLSGSLVAVVGAVAGFLFARGSAAAHKPGGTTAANAYGPSGSESGHLLAKVNDVPSGGGVILGKAGIVVTRTADGAVHAFSAVCTHQGCTVYRVAGGTIDCPCHGSRFDAGTGAVRAGPAPRPLPPITVEVRDGGVYTS
jgi:Rieske Fe-S protein